MVVVVGLYVIERGSRMKRVGSMGGGGGRLKLDLRCFDVIASRAFVAIMITQRMALPFILLGSMMVYSSNGFITMEPSSIITSVARRSRVRGNLYNSLRPPNDGNDDKRKKWGSGSEGGSGGRRRGKDGESIRGNPDDCLMMATPSTSAGVFNHHHH